MNKWYFVEYYNNFVNAYNLYHAPEGTETPKNMERISRKHAEQLARRERYARKYDHSFSGYADAYIYPLSLNRYDIDLSQVQSYALLNIAGWYIDGCAICNRGEENNNGTALLHRRENTP